jgi:hypothetical protein
LASAGAQRIDFAAGVADLARAIQGNARPRLDAAFSLHLTELALAIDAARSKPMVYRPETSFEPVTNTDQHGQLSNGSFTKDQPTVE